MIIKSFINKSIGFETSVTMLKGARYAVSIYDLDAYIYLPSHKIFLDRKNAIEYAKKCAQ